MVKRNSLIIGGIFLVALAVIFMFVPFDSAMTSPTIQVPTTQAPAPEQELILQARPVTAFCQIYPNAESC